ncbi:hypothetical protein F5Y14DRAFT_428890 [Nemania sp. NC0429]|nr:hypothetical protein F5Y14DRAFT_428890 [Nemania sp. NC0429]
MADVQLPQFSCSPVEDFFNSDPLPDWSGVFSLEQDTTNHLPRANLDDIEHTYKELHQSVDEVVAKIMGQTPPQLDQIRQQNRKLIEKLLTLEVAITGAPAAGLPVNCELHNHEDRGGKRRRVSFPTSIRSSARSGVDSYLDSQREHVSAVELEHVGSGRAARLSRLESDSKVVKMLLQVNSPEARDRVAEFAMAQARDECLDAARGLRHDTYQFSRVAPMTDRSSFVKLIQDLGLTIESSMLGEQYFRTRKRIALSHFYQAYALAQENAALFLSWCDSCGLQKSTSLAPKGGIKSTVQQRFADLVFARGGSSGETDDEKKRTAKIQMWRKSGRKWAQLIQRFGYGILLLLPPSLSDEQSVLSPTPLKNIPESEVNSDDLFTYVWTVCESLKTKYLMMFWTRWNLSNTCLVISWSKPIIS